MENLIGKKVERIGSMKDYTTGRTGTIIEHDSKGDRLRVLWTKEALRYGYGDINVRTWVNIKFLKIIN